MSEETSEVGWARRNGDVDAFLQRHRRAYWLTLRRDGSPTAHPMGALHEDGRVLFTSYRKSAKNRNIERDPRTCVLVASEYGSEPLRAVTLKGVARVLERAGVPRTLREQAGEGGVDRACAAIEAGRRAVIEIVPSEIADFSDRIRED